MRAWTGHVMYANTIFGANKSDLCMPTCVEKLKSFRPQFPRQVQNDRSQLFNTVAHKTNGLCGCNSSFPSCGGNKTALYVGPNCTGRYPVRSKVQNITSATWQRALACATVCCDDALLAHCLVAHAPLHICPLHIFTSFAGVIHSSSM